MSELGSQCRSVLMLPNCQQGAEILVSTRSQIVRKLMRKWLITSCGQVAQLSWIQSKSQFFFFCENENVSKMIISTNRSNQDILPRGECCIAKLWWRHDGFRLWRLQSVSSFGKGTKQTRALWAGWRTGLPTSYNKATRIVKPSD